MIFIDVHSVERNPQFTMLSDFQPPAFSLQSTSKKSFFEKRGSALLATLLLLLALSMLVILLLEKIIFEKRRALSNCASYQAVLAAESGLASGISQLTLATKNNPQLLIGETPQDHILLAGVTNLTTQEQLMPLISGDLKLLLDFPHIPQEKIECYLQTARDNNNIVNLNKKIKPFSKLATVHEEQRSEQLFASALEYRKSSKSITVMDSSSAPWVTITNSSGIPIARYAYRFFDEQACLNPRLHQGKPRNDPDNWDQGPSTLSLYLENNFLFSKEEASSLWALGDQHLLESGFSSAFRSNSDFENKKNFLSRSEVALSDFIPFSMPDGGKEKYNLNDLATNTIFGFTKSERAMHLAEIIDHNLPHFKERDPSLRNCSQIDQQRYLNRLAACIVDYINPLSAPTVVNGGEPAGQVLAPLATQVAERLRLQSCNSNSVTIETQYFVQAWNPYTKTIRGGDIVSFSIVNRPLLHFGTAEPTAFENYHQSTIAPTIRPNESVVLTFPTVTQTWSSPTSVTPSNHPYWLRGPEGNADPKRHQRFQFFWNHQLVTMSRQPPIGPGLAEGGLEHNEGSLSSSQNDWHCNFIPTEQDRSGHFRFVGDPRENYLSNYLWKSYSGEKSYLEETRWQGVMSDTTSERIFNPMDSWIARDFIPNNPPAGNHPSSIAMTPDQVFSSYQAEDALHAPLVMRHGPMNSIVELGNIDDPAQADDLGAAPEAGSSDHQPSIYACGGGRTLRIGQPEFSYWDVPGKRAIELLDLFTVSSQRKKGLININTAPHAVMTALFYGITPTSDQRFLHSQIQLEAAEHLATLTEEHRPYEKISDLHILTSLLANAETYSPPLGSNLSSGLAAVFDRAREEGFGKMISLCTIHSRAFRLLILGQSLDRYGKSNAETTMEAIIVLSSSDSKKNLVPVVKEIKWL